ncbi:hypothetical protein T190423A01A_10002 [Tenacibaculum sp. 190130A14a]|uniref:Uncharacterized protein n=1 Tax=Tenacibaculum polynesiense TaxID=3137857 RepID=A0ABP1EVW9_9FLAO
MSIWIVSCHNFFIKLSQLYLTANLSMNFTVIDIKKTSFWF